MNLKDPDFLKEKYLALQSKAIGAVGMQAFASAVVASGALASLREL
jgi:hypothetical protein